MRLRVVAAVEATAGGSAALILAGWAEVTMAARSVEATMAGGWVESTSAAEPSPSISGTIEVWDTMATTATTMDAGRPSKVVRGGCAIPAKDVGTWAGGTVPPALLCIAVRIS